MTTLTIEPKPFPGSTASTMDLLDSRPSLARHLRGSGIYAAGEEGVAWRVRLGAVRLDHYVSCETRFAGVAVAGDVIGAEVLMFGRYTYSARALSDVTLEPWSSSLDEVVPGSFVQLLSGIERRAADSLALRSGTAERRIGQLLGLIGRGLALGRGKVRVALPTLRDIAEITGLTIETVSRTIKSLRGNGELEMVGERRAREVWVESQPFEPTPPLGADSVFESAVRNAG